MKADNRLSGALPPEFSTPVIDRNRPLTFRLNGRTFRGFEGDTVLSALLGQGVVSVGHANGSALALDPDSAPAVVLAGNGARPDLAMPMALCPAVAGADLITTGPAPALSSSWRSRLAARAGTSLDLAFGAHDPAPGGWIDTPPTRTITADLTVVGAGVAGLSAAIAAAKRGLRVCVVDKEPVLGGLSVFFGKAEGEAAPQDMIDQLADEIGQSGLITLLLGTLAFDLTGTELRAIRVRRTQDRLAPEHIAIAAKSVVLATGMTARLPIFAGNRLPGVVDAALAWRMAARYHVWPGQSAIVNTATNAGYRLALLGAASERHIERASDPRVNPQTRFIEFCKAYGYRLGWGVSIAAVAQRRNRLAITMADSETGAIADGELLADRLIVSGGWQPDLDLWLRAGGPVEWNGASGQLRPWGALSHVKLAGAAAGYLSLAGCSAHGRAAVELVLGGVERDIADPRIDPMFETPDGPQTFMPPSTRTKAAAWLSPTRSDRVDPMPPGARFGFGKSKVSTGVHPSTAQTQLDVIGAVLSGRLDPAHVAAFCAERVIVPHILFPATPETVRHHASGLPPYLEQRFGEHQGLWRLAQQGHRQFGVGCLLFANTDARAPRDAVGVLVSTQAEGLTALIGGEHLASGDTVYVRDGLATVPVRLEKRL